MRRTRLFKCMLAGALAAAAAGAYAGQITIYEGQDFYGRSMVVGDAMPNLVASPLNRTTASIVVNDGTWEACTEAYYRGRCVQLAPGRYSRLGGEFASVRQMAYDPGRVALDSNANTVTIGSAGNPIVINPGQSAVVVNPSSTPLVIDPRTSPTVVTSPPPTVVAAPPVVTLPPATVPGDTRIVLYQREGLGTSRAVELKSNVDDLDARRFENRANAAFIAGGIWRLCDRPMGKGYCADFSPGRYDTLGSSLDGRVSSAYVVAAEPVRVSGNALIPSGRMVLYQYPNFGGPAAVVENGRSPDLDWAKFKDRAASLRVESGTWLICSDLGYEGECKLVGPGEYPQVSNVVRDGVYSAREVWHPQYGVADIYRTR